MEEKLLHLVMTRLNVAHRDGRHLDPQWLADRLQLLRTTCLPSMQAQTIQDFEWVLLVDLQTPAEFLDQLLELRERQPFKLIGVRDRFSLVFAQRMCLHWLWERGDPPWLITSILDSDDALARGYVASMQARVGKGDVLVNLLDGVEACTVRRQLYHSQRRRNEFMSLIERTPVGREPTTVWAYTAYGRHREPPPDIRVLDLTAGFSWCRFHHGRNTVGNPLPQVSAPQRLDLWDTFGVGDWPPCFDPPANVQTFEQASAEESPGASDETA